MVGRWDGHGGMIGSPWWAMTSPSSRHDHLTTPSWPTHHLTMVMPRSTTASRVKTWLGNVISHYTAIAPSPHHDQTHRPTIITHHPSMIAPSSHHDHIFRLAMMTPFSTRVGRATCKYRGLYSSKLERLGWTCRLLQSWLGGGVAMAGWLGRHGGPWPPHRLAMITPSPHQDHPTNPPWSRRSVPQRAGIKHSWVMSCHMQLQFYITPIEAFTDEKSQLEREGGRDCMYCNRNWLTYTTMYQDAGTDKE